MADGDPTYDEARQFAYWLEVFTPRDLAGVMRVDEDVVRGYVVGMVRTGTIGEAGSLNGGAWQDVVYELLPLPDGPRVHPTEPTPDVTTPGTYAEAPRRGWPVGNTRALKARAAWSGVGRRRPGRSQAKREKV